MIKKTNIPFEIISPPNEAKGINRIRKNQSEGYTLFPKFISKSCKPSKEYLAIISGKGPINQSWNKPTVPGLAKIPLKTKSAVNKYKMKGKYFRLMFRKFPKNLDISVFLIKTFEFVIASA